MDGPVKSGSCSTFEPLTSENNQGNVHREKSGDLPECLPKIYSNYEDKMRAVTTVDNADAYKKHQDNLQELNLARRSVTQMRFRRRSRSAKAKNLANVKKFMRELTAEALESIAHVHRRRRWRQIAERLF